MSLEDTTFDLSSVPDEYRDRMEGMIPDPRVATHIYTPRHPGGYHEFDAFDRIRSKRGNVLLEGPTASGKTIVSRAYAAARRLPYVRVLFNGGLDFPSLLGKTHIDSVTGEVSFVHGDLALVCKFGGVCLYDEINMAPPRFVAPAHSTLDADRRLMVQDNNEVIKLHPDTFFIGAYNGGSGYVGTSMLNEAFKERWMLNLEWGYDEGVERIRIGSESEALLEAGWGLRELDEIQTPVSTGLMENFIKVARLFDYDMAVTSLVNRFDEVEKPIVSRVLEAHASRIADDLGIG